MKCPVCPDATLSVGSREGIEIDYCPRCRGVWLDRNELDKIIERSAGLDSNYHHDTGRGRTPASVEPPRGTGYPPPAPPHHGSNDSSHGDYRYQDPRHSTHGKPRKSWLRDLMDF
jgi:Zn-finger nucleic acid-binding protein